MKAYPHNALLVSLLWILSASGPSLPGADWPQFRGPNFNGSSGARNLPETWSVTENVVWRTKLPGPGSGAPAIVGDIVYVSTFDRDSGQVAAMALGRKKGNVIWKVPVGEGVNSTRFGRENYMAESSPVASDQGAIFQFGTGDLMAFDQRGEIRWQRNLSHEYGRFVINFGYANSPLLFDGRLFVEILDRRKGLVLALDPDTGEYLWVAERWTDARAESREAYTTPFPFQNGGRVDLLVFGGDMLTAYDPATGRERWRWAEFNPFKRENFRVVSSPVAAGETVVVTAPQLNPMYGLELRDGKPEVKWIFEKPTPDVPTPAYYDGKLFVLAGRRNTLSCLNPQTGHLIWQGRLEKSSYLRASPTAADGKLFIISAEGEAFVVSAGDEFKILSRIEMGEYPCRAPIVAVDDRLYIRTGASLYCIGKSIEGGG